MLDEVIRLDRGRPVRMQARRLRSHSIVCIAVANVSQLEDVRLVFQGGDGDKSME